jgi:hypothetical protein
VRDAVLVRLGQAVDVSQYGGVIFAVLEIELASAAEFADEQQDAVPEQEALVVLDAVLTARVGDVVEPTVEVGEGRPFGACGSCGSGSGPRPADGSRPGGS